MDLRNEYEYVVVTNNHGIVSATLVPELSDAIACKNLEQSDIKTYIGRIEWIKNA